MFNAEVRFCSINRPLVSALAIVLCEVMSDTKGCLCVLVYVVKVEGVCFSYQVHLPSKFFVLGCFLTQDQEVIFLARNFRILIKNTFEVFCRDWVDDLLVFLTSHVRVQIQN
jgi:hypothetical protein